MIETKLKTGDVVQISPDVPNEAVRGCYLTVTEMTDFTDPTGQTKPAVKGYITSPGHSDSIRITMTVPDFEHIEFVGDAKFMHEAEWVSI